MRLKIFQTYSDGFMDCYTSLDLLKTYLPVARRKLLIEKIYSPTLILIKNTQLGIKLLKKQLLTYIDISKAMQDDNTKEYLVTEVKAGIKRGEYTGIIFTGECWVTELNEGETLADYYELIKDTSQYKQRSREVLSISAQLKGDISRIASIPVIRNSEGHLIGLGLEEIQRSGTAGGRFADFFNR